MGPQIVVLSVLVGLIILLFTELVRPSVSFMLAILVLLGFETITPKEALAGFSNEQLAIIVLLLLISSVLSKTQLLKSLFKGTIAKNSNQNSFLVKLTVLVGGVSAFFNNTPLVAMFMPLTHKWGVDNKVSPSKLLIPLSYASILGGCVTLVGTSTNLIVNGLAIDYGAKPLLFFDFALVGGLMLVVGLLYLIFVGSKLLPSYATLPESIKENAREYFLEAHVNDNSKIIGKTVEEASLRNLEGLYLVEILRENKKMSPVSPKEIFREKDILFFAGNPEKVEELTKPEMGLSLPNVCNVSIKESQNLVEVVIAANSRLVNKTVKESDFRGRYDGAIIAIHRNGEKLWGKLGEIILKAGDVLLIKTGQDFIVRTKNNPGFYVLNSQDNEEKEIDQKKVVFVFLGLVSSFVLMQFGISLMISLAAVLSLCILFKITTPTKIRNSIDFNLILIIAFGLALGKAMNNSGLSLEISDLLMQMESSTNIYVVLAVLFSVTNILAAVITSKAAVAITVPIAISLATSMKIDASALILCVAFGGAANFITPLGYQTNLMVYGPGQYKFKDFISIGLPLTILYMIVTVILLTLQFDLR